MKQRHAARTDANQPEILEILRGIGAQAWFIGWPLDLLVAFRGRFHVLEVKMPGGKLSKKQKTTMMQMEACGCKAHVVYSPGDVLRAIGAIGNGSKS